MRRLLGFLLAGACACAAAQSPAPNTAAAASRELWLGTEGRYVRQWRMSEPMTAIDADLLAKAGSTTTLQDDQSRVWRSNTTYGDTLEFGAMKDGEVSFALATVEWPAEGEARLLLGGNVRGVWVNGAWNGGAENSPAFVVDGTEVKTRLVQGANRILLRVERLDRPVRIALRVVPPGFAPEPDVIAPYLVTEGDTLKVYPGTDPAPPNPLVKYEVVAAGGQVLADNAPPFNQPATFNAARFPDGPYEIRASTRTAFNETVIEHLPWFKGDVNAAAQRVLDAAAAPDAGGHVKMLADMIRDRQGGDRLDLHSPLMEFAELALERAGQPGGARAGGFVRLAWTDEVDGSTQFCRAYLPANFPAQRALPALLFLHGFNPPNPPYVRWWSVAERHNSVAERHGLIVLEPMARGNTDYRTIGELDVLRCLAEARARFNIDGDRIYLTGESMGGNGTWMIASRHPQLFAAAAPVHGGWDYRIIPPGFGFLNPDATRPMERFMQEAHSSFAGAEGLLNVPLYVVHGDVDYVVPVDFSRHGVKLLQRWGYDVRYREIPGRGHEDLEARHGIAEWLLGHRRQRAPREVRLRSYDLAGAQAHWVRVAAWETPFELMEARARVVDELVIRLDTKNVASIVLNPSPDLLYGKAYTRSRGWTVIWNGVRHVVASDSDGRLRLDAAGVEHRPGDKSADREGRLSFFFNTPFAVVVGTSAKDPALKKEIEEKARGFVDVWRRWQHVEPRVFRDTEVTADIEQRYSLLLIGGADANRVSARLAGKLPLKVAADGFTLDGRRFAGRDAVAQLLYPHPSNPARYVLLVASNSTAGMRFWNPGAFRHPVYNFPTMLWDWTIVDGRRFPLQPGFYADRSWIAAGIFDAHWRRDDRFTVTGDATARERAPLRVVPPTPPKLPAEQLAALAGRYVANPGQPEAGLPFVVTLEDGALAVTIAGGGPRIPLEAETATDFSVVGSGVPVRFLVDGDGKATGMLVDNFGADLVTTRMP